MEEKNIWHRLDVQPDFERGDGRTVDIVLTDGRDVMTVMDCSAHKFCHAGLIMNGAKAWAYADQLLDGSDEGDAPLAYQFDSVAERVFGWLVDDGLKLIGVVNWPIGDQTIPNTICTLEYVTMPKTGHRKILLTTGSLHLACPINHLTDVDTFKEFFGKHKISVIAPNYPTFVSQPYMRKLLQHADVKDLLRDLSFRGFERLIDVNDKEYNLVDYEEEEKEDEV